jgi:ketosteroid isomerase-like protein
MGSRASVAASSGDGVGSAATDADWLQALLRAIDARDAEGFADFLTEDARLRFANAEPILGRPAIRTVIAGFFQAVAGLSHELEESWHLPGAVICRGEVTYRRLDGGALRVPFANVLKLRGEKVSEYLIYVDNSALWASAPSDPSGTDD